MGKLWKLGGVYKFNGDKVVVSAINDDGTLVLNYAAGSGKTGFAGKVAGVKQPLALLPDGFLVAEADVEDGDEVVSLESYDSYVEIGDPQVLVDEMVALSQELVDGWQRTIDNVDRIHNETTANLAKISGLTVDEYEFWLDNPKRASEPTWVGLEFDENNVLRNARVVSQNGNLITVQSNGLETLFVRYIGDKYMNSKIVKDVFTEEKVDLLDDVIRNLDY